MFAAALQAIGEARVAIESYMADPTAETVAPRGEATPEALARPSALRRWAPLAIAVLVAGLVSSILTREFQPEVPGPPVRRFAIEAEGFNRGWTSEPVISPDGTAIAYPSEQGITIRYLAQIEPRTIDIGAAPNWVIWSPDGQHIAYETDEAKGLPGGSGPRRLTPYRRLARGPTSSRRSLAR